MPHIFVSHATADDPTVTRLHNELEAAGIETWVDHVDGLEPGDNWAREIQQAAHDCAAGLFILSPASAQSAYCEAEWNRVLALGKRLYIAMIESVPLKDIPLRLGTIQYADLAKDWAGGLDALRKAIANNTDLNPDAPAVAQAAPISGSFPRWHLDLPLIGRDAELKTVQDALKSDQRIVAVLGLGGVGKTRLAVEVAARADFPAGVVWHTITPQSTISQLTLTIRDHLRLPQTAEDDAIWAKASQSQMLIVLDNAEDCAQPAAYAARLNVLDHARVLVTSRAAWRELRHVKPLDLRAPDLDSAVAILKAMSALEPPNFSLNGHETALAEAARRHPRLMQYAVRWLNTYPPDYVLSTLHSLKGADADEALNEMVLKTVEQVRQQTDGEETIAALRRLAVGRGGFTFSASLAIMKPTDSTSDSPRPEGEGQGVRVDFLARLVQWGLVALEQGRYTIDPLVIAAVGEDLNARRTHFDYYHTLAQHHDDKQDYLGLDPESANLEAAFEWALGSGDGEDALWLTNNISNFLYNRGRFAQILNWSQRLTDKLANHPDKMLWANAQNSLGSDYESLPIGNRRENLRRAIACYQSALEYNTPSAAPLDYAGTQNNLGVAYKGLAAIEDHTANLHRAIDAFQVALEYYTPTVAPLRYAMTQNNLGAVYTDLAAIEDHIANLRRAIACYQAVLEYYTPSAVPLKYAMTQNNLGNAYADLATIEDHIANLRCAIDAFQVALEYYTPSAAPLGFALTQNNLGLAYSDLAALEDPINNLHRAIACYQVALEYYTPSAAPLDFALTQNNLGAAYRKLAAVEDRDANLRHAIECYQVALEYYTPSAAPLDFAMTQRNLGIAYEKLDYLPATIACWREAEIYFRQMDHIEDADLMLRWIAEAEAQLKG
ncbi:MAG: TIR domain-containing protein [Anaerolineae bacterium]|nr:TIR domain-containing protein [Anaerolineae bacterium]